MFENTTLTKEQLITLVNDISTQDAWWHLYSSGTLLLLGLLIFFLRRLVLSHDKMKELIVTMMVEQRGIDVELKDHIKNDGMHCKGLNCQALLSVRPHANGP